jgi:hypothetical protein
MSAASVHNGAKDGTCELRCLIYSLIDQAAKQPIRAATLSLLE